jgi:hypothetical protein
MDAFAVFGEERRPWLDPEVLKDKFTRLSAEGHPDRFRAEGGEALERAEREYAGLNTAYQVLREPRTRLPLLIELEFGSRPSDIQRIPPGTMDVFVEVGQACRDVDDLLQRRESAGSALQKAGLMGEVLDVADRVQELLGKVEGLRGELDEKLRAADEAWVSGARDREGLEALYRRYSYVARWGGQLRERVLALL